MKLTKAEDLAADFGITVEHLHRLRREKAWPSVKLGRYDVRFTDAQIEEIVAMQSVVKPKSTTRPAIEGQTFRSASRRSA